MTHRDIDATLLWGLVIAIAFSAILAVQFCGGDLEADWPDGTTIHR